MKPFYEIPKSQRDLLVKEIYAAILADLNSDKQKIILAYISNEDTYIRKTAYLAIGRIYFNEVSKQQNILNFLRRSLEHQDFKIRQTVINAAGEIGKREFEIVQPFFDTGLFDAHHSPRNAVIGSIKKMGEVNPTPVLDWAKTYLHHPDKEIRREICHGIELRGRKYPEDILPLLKELEFDETNRVKKTLIHVIGQIAYKKGCLETIIEDLKSWKNHKLVEAAIAEIIDVHYRYRYFSDMSQEEAKKYISENFK